MDSILAYAQDQSTGSTSIELIFQIASIVGLWKMFEKAGEPGWTGIIPIYNLYKLCEVTMGYGWYILRLLVFFIPVVGWIAGFYFMFQIGKATAKAYGQPEGYAWGYLFLSPIFYCLTGFGEYSYYGPYGQGDNRSASAREAKTVNFDVVKDQPRYADDTVVEPVREEPVVVEPVREEPETVEFNFDQPEE